MATSPVGNKGPDLKMSKTDMGNALKAQMSPKAAIQRNSISQMVAKMSSARSNKDDD